MTRNQALMALLLFVLMATAGAVWQFGQYGLYGGAGLLLLIFSFIDIDKPDKKKGGADDG